MSKRKRDPRAVADQPEPLTVDEPAIDDPDQAAAVGEPAPDGAEPEAQRDRAPEEGSSAGAALEDLQDQHLRLAAEFDNYRKRTARERLEERARSQGELAAALLDALDDLGRVAHLDPTQTNAADVVAGVELVERKLLKELGDRGLERLGTPDEPFNPMWHEAIGSVPAPTPEQDHTVANVLQHGYRYGAALLRPARVQVYLDATGG